MGRDKALVRVEGVALVERVARALGGVVERVSIVLRPGAPAPLDLPRVDDRHAVRAPIAGLCAALAAARAPAVLVAACDLPWLDPALLLALLALAPAEGGADAVVPVGPRGPEPLLAVYRTRLVPELERRIAANRLALQALVREIDAQFIPEDILRAIDPDLRSLHNVNRPGDLEG